MPNPFLPINLLLELEAGVRSPLATPLDAALTSCALSSGGVKGPTPPPPVYLGWYNYDFRSSTNGTTPSGWITPADLPTDTGNKTQFRAGTTAVGYPTLSTETGLNWGANGGASAADVSSANAAANPLLGGTVTANNATFSYPIQTSVPQSGNYNVRIGLANNAHAVIIPYLKSELSTALQVYGYVDGNNINRWLTSLSPALHTAVVTTDGSFWVCSNAGSLSGAVEPTAASTTPPNTLGAVITSGTASLKLAAGPGTTVAGGTVLDAGTVAADHVYDTSATSGGVAASAWGSNFITVNISTPAASGISVLRPGNQTCTIQTMGIQLAETPLSDATLTDVFGNAAPSPQIWAAQPSGELAYTATFPTGSISNITLGGTLGPYLNVTNESGAIKFRHNGTPIPDSMSVTAQSLQVIQTDALSVGSPHTTTFSVNVISSQGKPTSTLVDPVWALVTTNTWLQHKRVTDVTRTNIWPGYQGQTIAPANDLGPTTSFNGGGDPTSLISLLNSITPDKSSWYRIRIGAASYQGGYYGSTIKLDFGTGGLLIEPDTGQDPEMHVGFSGLQIHGLHVRNLLWPNNQLVANTSEPTFNFTDPGPSGINGGNNFNRAKFENIRTGFLHSVNPAPDLTQPGNQAAQFIYIYHGESVEVTGCSAWGCQWVMAGYSRAFRMALTDVQGNWGDVWDPTHSPKKNRTGQITTGVNGTTTGVFADDNIYADQYKNTIWNDFQKTHPIHYDTTQISTGPYGDGGGLSFIWSATMTISVGNGNQTIITPQDTVPWIWHTTASGVTPTTMPTYAAWVANGSTNPLTLDGSIPWTLQGPAILNEMVVTLEGVTQSSSSITTAQFRQFFLDSNAGRRFKTTVSAVDCLGANITEYGVQVGSNGGAWVEHCSFVGAPAYLSNTNAGARIGTSGTGPIAFNPTQTMFTRNNVTMVASSVSGAQQAFTSIGAELIIAKGTWNSAPSGSPPATITSNLTGPFVSDGASPPSTIYQNVTDDGSVSAATFRSQLRGSALTKGGSLGLGIITTT